MKDACKECRFAKEKSGNSYYCVKYGIIIGYGKVSCIAFERDAHIAWRDDEQVQEQKNGDQRDQIRQQA